MFSTLLESYEKPLVEEIINHPWYDERLLCSIIPSLCGKEEREDDEAKLHILAFNPSFFFYFGSIIDSVPDLRSLSKETKSTFNLRPWNPWFALEEEFETLLSAEERGDRASQEIFNLLMPEEKKNYINEEREMTRFFYTYPIISHLFFLNEENLIFAVTYDYFNVDFLPRTMPLSLAYLARSDKMVKWIFGNVNPLIVIAQKHKGDNKILQNIFVIRWLINKDVQDRIPIEDLFYTIALADDEKSFQRVYMNDDFEKWFSTSITYRSKRIFSLLLNMNSHMKNMVIAEIGLRQERDRWSFLLSSLGEKYGIKRFYGSVDTLLGAIEYKYIEWIKALPKEDLIDPIVSEDISYHPMEIIFDKDSGFLSAFSQKIIPYLLEVYEETLEDILYQLVIHRSVSGVEAIISYHSFSRDSLALSISFVHAESNEDDKSENLIFYLANGIRASPPEDLPPLSVTLSKEYT